MFLLHSNIPGSSGSSYSVVGLRVRRMDGSLGGEKKVGIDVNVPAVKKAETKSRSIPIELDSIVIPPVVLPPYIGTSVRIEIDTPSKHYDTPPKTHDKPKSYETQ